LYASVGPALPDLESDVSHVARQVGGGNPGCVPLHRAWTRDELADRSAIDRTSAEVLHSEVDRAGGRLVDLGNSEVGGKVSPPQVLVGLIPPERLDVVQERAQCLDTPKGEEI